MGKLIVAFVSLWLFAFVSLWLFANVYAILSSASTWMTDQICEY